MTTAEDILKLVNGRLGRVLTIAEAAMPKEQFQAFRRVALDEFGRNGFGREVARLFDGRMDDNGYGLGRHRLHGKEDDHD